MARKKLPEVTTAGVEGSISPAGEQFALPRKEEYGKEFRRVEKLAARARVEGKEVVVVMGVVFAVPHAPYLDIGPEDIVSWAGRPLAVIDCFGILSDESIRTYFELGCEVKALGRGHIQRIKEEVRKQAR